MSILEFSVNRKGGAVNKSKSLEIPKQVVWEAWQAVKKNKGSHGVDGESISECELNLKDNLYKLWNRMSSGCYFPPPIRGVDIPKANGKIRRLGIPTVLDRVAQTAIKMMLEPKLEPIFHENSYGYRPGRSAHDAISVTKERCFELNWVLEFDIVGMFDNIPHDLVLKALRHHESEKLVLLYAERWLKAPMVSPNGVILPRVKGVSQGGVISPLLMNLFMHYVFDMWMQREFPDLKWCRYADDGLIHCRTEAEGIFLQKALQARLEACGLELHPDKTWLVYCADGFRRKKTSRPKEFKFLGFDFKARPAKSKRANKIFMSFQPAVSKTAIRAMKHRIKHEWDFRKRVQLDLKDLAALVNPAVRGWLNYYSRFYKTGMYQICKYLNQALSLWAKRKYRRLYRRFSSCFDLIKSIYCQKTKLFVHWEFMKLY